MTLFLRRLWFALSIVGREHWCGICTPSEAWDIAKSTVTE